jgi:signal transduction histidine kinase
MQPTILPATARRRWVDAGLIVALVGASLVWGDYLLRPGVPDDKLMRTFGSVGAWQTYLVWWWLSVVPLAAAIVLRHRWPLAATLMAAGAAATHLFDGRMPLLPVDLAVLITVYTLAGSERGRRSGIAVLIALEGLLYTAYLAASIGLTSIDPAQTPEKVLVGDRLGQLRKFLHGGDTPAALLNATKTAAVPVLLLAATWAVADSARNRRAYVATLQARADDLEREQQQRTALAVAAERGRITRELHDVVAHGLSVMVVQAQGARAMLRRQPERTEAALTTIVSTGRGSLAEMRRLLGLVRTDQPAELAPQPGLAALPELLDRVRDSGTPVALHITGEPATLPGVVELAAYRIVQEALTNTLKHASPGTSCTVALDFGPAGLAIRVTDTGGPVPPPVPGNGLRGIAERVHALGGELRTGAIATGFEVFALLPGSTDESVSSNGAPGASQTPEDVL